MKTKLTKIIGMLSVMLITGSTLKAQCTNNCQVDAGPNKNSACPGGHVVIGVTNCISGGAAGCTYSITWTPSSLVVSGQGTCKPTVNPTVTTKFYMTVKMNGNCCCSGAAGSCASSSCDSIIKKDSMTVTVSNNGCRLMPSMMNNGLDNSSISISPNPTSGKINVQVEEKLFESLAVQAIPVVIAYDFTGKMMKSIEAEESNIEIDLSEHAKGIYFLRVLHGDNTLAVKKVIVN